MGKGQRYQEPVSLRLKEGAKDKAMILTFARAVAVVVKLTKRT